MARTDENRGFICINCSAAVKPLSNGSYRNHCPVCLCSVHVDVRLGDRANLCAGLMVPAALTYSGNKGWQIVHRCRRCGTVRSNKVAAETDQPDDVARVAALSGRRA
jgi:hypothetical protein